MCWCGRVSAGSIRENRGGQYLHRLKAAAHATHAWNPVVHLHVDPHQEQVPDWAQLAGYYAQNAAVRIMNLAKQLGVSYASLADQGAGWSDRRECWTFPERNGSGKIVGILTRDLTGKKRRIKGSQSGLSFTCDWNAGDGPIFLVEGPSDFAALKTIGLSAVGRPSNRGGVAFLTNLLFDVPAQREIIVVGERDQKPTGLWPGKEGAISVATQLAEALERPIAWGFPPDNAKDSRAWLQAMPQLPIDRLADLFVTGIDTKTIDPPIMIPVEPEPTNTLDLGTWRVNMLEARIASLGRPGIYLDRSPTGSGKSHVDFAAVQALLQREDAA
jgi:hypothetical protein